MGRELNLKTATRFVLLTLANESGSKDAGFVAYQAALAADTGMSISALKSHLSILRRGQLVIAGDPRMVAHIPVPERPCVYRLNYWIDVATARRYLDTDPVDNSGSALNSGQPESGDRQNPANQTPETRENMDRQNLATQTPGLQRLGSQNPATNPLRGLYGGTSSPRRVNNSKAKTTDDGKRLCMECTTRKPIGLMVQRDDKRFICESHL
jgi:hypothetical protein